MERLDDKEYVALAAFREAIRRYLHEAEHAARAVGITPAQHQLLLAVRGYGRQEPPSITDLSRTLYTKVQSTLELVRRAEVAGLVTRTRDHLDARRQLVRLTRRGVDMLDAFYTKHQNELAAARTELREALRVLSARTT